MENEQRGIVAGEASGRKGRVKAAESVHLALLLYLAG